MNKKGVFTILGILISLIITAVIILIVSQKILESRHSNTNQSQKINDNLNNTIDTYQNKSKQRQMIEVE